ncbi:MAG TPA: oxalate/formate MFS antiporter [Reyranella sp.]|nr:oxalate/formate MFS antiporter [Reyranella sp.]
MSNLTAAQQAPAAGSAALSRPWLQLVMGIVCMAMIANLQYGWTLFVEPIDAKHHWGRTAIQVAFSIFVLAETWLLPIKSWFVDKHSPRLVVSIGGVLVGIAWVINSYANTLLLLYAGALIGGAGAAAVYGSCVGNALKWFPRRRGLAAGLTAAGFGAGAAITVIPISNMIKSSGYEAAFLYFGIGQGVVILIVSMLLRKPSEAEMAAAGRRRSAAQDAHPLQMVRTPVFWSLYVAFVLMAFGGLMLAAQIAPIAKDMKIANVPVSIAGLTMAALTFAISIDRILDGFGRPFFGWVSDQIGREYTMCGAFVTAAVALFLLDHYGSSPTIFVLSTGLFFLVFGEIYSLFPATCGDTFGATYATTNAGLLYTAKGTASLLVPLAGALAAASAWHEVYLVAMCTSLGAAAMALFVVRPLRAKYLAQHVPDGN